MNGWPKRNFGITLTPRRIHFPRNNIPFPAEIDAMIRRADIHGTPLPRHNTYGHNNRSRDYDDDIFDDDY